MDIFELIYDVFSFANGILYTITEGITGIINIMTSLVNLFIRIAKLLPNPLFPCLQTFLYLYLVIFIFKLVRKG